MLDNLLSGFLGAVIALIISAVFSRYSEAKRLNRIRRSVITYLEKLAKPKIDRYVEDCEKAIKHLNQEAIPDHEKNKGFDDMPMLTSEVIKSFQQSDLIVLSKDDEVYSNILNFYYCVDYLKKNMPMNICNDFAILSKKHFEKKEILNTQDQLRHLKTCPFICQQREHQIQNFRKLIETAKGVRESMGFICKSLTRSSVPWKFKYFFR